MEQSKIIDNIARRHLLVTVPFVGLMLNQAKAPYEMPPPKHAYGHAMIIWCVWALRRNLSNMFTMPVSVPTSQISAINTTLSLNHLSKNLNSVPLSLGCHLNFMKIHLPYH